MNDENDQDDEGVDGDDDNNEDHDLDGVGALIRTTLPNQKLQMRLAVEVMTRTIIQKRVEIYFANEQKG